MRKIINGKAYDTRTAKLLGAWQSPGMSRRDVGYTEEELYVNRKGAYFLHGVGGGASGYATRSGSAPYSYGWGERVTPMTREEAMAWAETKLNADEYEATFGEVADAKPNDQPRERVNFVMDPRQLAGLRRLSADTGIPMSRLVGAALDRIHGARMRELLADAARAARAAKECTGWLLESKKPRN